MKHLKTAAILSIASSGAAYAGGLERTDQSVSVLFEKGRYLEFGYVYASPDVSGTGSSLTPTPGQDTGNISESFDNLRFAFKDDINDRLSYAIIYDEPYGSDVAYPTSTYFASNAQAEVTTRALTGILQYNFPQETLSPLGGTVSVYGGARAQFIDASANVPFVSGYVANAESDIGFGYLFGAAFEKPELGMRVSLTYTSEINSELDTQESFGGAPFTSTTTDIDTPESINLEFQTGLNPQTLLFGSVRWVSWSDFEVAPPLYQSATGSPLAFFADDRITYRLGVGRKINDNWSLFGSVGYEHSTGSPTTNLTPVDGFISYSLGATYNMDKARITVAARYADLGDADTALGTTTPAGQFTDNSLWGIGVRIGFDLN